MRNAGGVRRIQRAYTRKGKRLGGRALYAGSFDPITNGHLEVIQKSLRLFEHLTVAVGINSAKNPLLPLKTRHSLIQDVVQTHLSSAEQERVAIVPFEELLCNFARKNGISILVRGLRNSLDFEEEMQMAAMNATLDPNLQTVFIPSSSSVRFISGSLVRQIAQMGGGVEAFVPKVVVDHLAGLMVLKKT